MRPPAVRLHPKSPLRDYIHDAAGFSGAGLHVSHLAQDVCRRRSRRAWRIPGGPFHWVNGRSRTRARRPDPFATMDGMAGCSSGNQSGGLMRSSTCARV